MPMKRAGRIVNRIILILGIAMIAYYLALGFAVRFGQSLQFLWLIGGCLCIARYFYWRHVEKSGKYPRNRGLLRALRVLFCLALAFFLSVEGVILCGGMMQPEPGLDYIVVLGAKVNGTVPSGSLRNRIQVGVEYLRDNPETIAVLSGGQGSDEDISEARCMYENMVAAGIDPARLSLEEQSTDTAENLRFSRALIPEGASVGIVTNNFHIFRALALARNQGWEDVHGVPVATTMFSLPHYLMREFVGMVYETVRGNLTF
ncbi:MAG: YdcF family protein [Aristaeellaceae bacterium]